MASVIHKGSAEHKAHDLKVKELEAAAKVEETKPEEKPADDGKPKIPVRK